MGKRSCYRIRFKKKERHFQIYEGLLSGHTYTVYTLILSGSSERHRSNTNKRKLPRNIFGGNCNFSNGYSCPKMSWVGNDLPDLGGIQTEAEQPLDGDIVKETQALNMRLTQITNPQGPSTPDTIRLC